jgi:hypothetical protein
VWALGDVERSVWLVVALAAAWVALRAWRLGRARRLDAFVYEETEPPVATTIDLGMMRA